ncbi:MAG: hypothetical protein HY884_07320 [Deltaproteobacteria bacterium]|nr:hypothetical protein [Deltaproteobacteria bacterium]
MNKTFKTIIRTLTATALLIAKAYAEGNTTLSAANTKVSMRETLIGSAAIERVYAIDGHHTLVIGADAVLSVDNGITIIKKYEQGEIAPVPAYLLRHDLAQPFAFKNPAITGNLLPTTGNKITFGSLINAKDAYVELDLAQQAIAACEKTGGDMTFVIPKASGNYARLVSVDAAVAFDYLAQEAVRDTTWFAACSSEGNSLSRFLVEKYYGHKASPVKTAKVFPGRTLEGIAYVREFTAPAETEVKYNPAEHAAERALAAQEAAAMKSGFVKPDGQVKYTGVYNGEYKNTGCARVTVKVTGRLSLRNTLQAKAYDFKVCKGLAAFLGENDRVDMRHVYAAYTK